MLRRWRDLLASLGASLVGVAEAEVTALKQDLRFTGRQFAVAIGLVVVAAILGFWVVGATCFVLYQVGILWLPGWAAALIVLGLLLVVVMILAGVARSRLRALEAPVDTVRRRVDDHVDWWQSNLLAPEEPDTRPKIEEQGDAG